MVTRITAQEYRALTGKQKPKRQGKHDKTFEHFLQQLALLGYPEPKPEYKFLTDRKYRFDRAWVEFVIAVEYEGGVWISGRHNRPSGYIIDCEKYSLASIAGWILIRLTKEIILSGVALELVEAAFRARGYTPESHRNALGANRGSRIQDKG